MCTRTKLITYLSKTTACKDCLYVLLCWLFPQPLAKGCNIYNPQKVRQGGSEYKRHKEMEASVRKKGD